MPWRTGEYKYPHVSEITDVKKKRGRDGGGEEVREGDGGLSGQRGGGGEDNDDWQGDSIASSGGSPGGGPGSGDGSGPGGCGDGRGRSGGGRRAGSSADGGGVRLKNGGGCPVFRCSFKTENLPELLKHISDNHIDSAQEI